MLPYPYETFLTSDSEEHSGLTTQEIRADVPREVAFEDLVALMERYNRIGDACDRVWLRFRDCCESADLRLAIHLRVRWQDIGAAIARTCETAIRKCVTPEAMRSSLNDIRLLLQGDTFHASLSFATKVQLLNIDPSDWRQPHREPHPTDPTGRIFREAFARITSPVLATSPPANLLGNSSAPRSTDQS